MKLKYLGHPMKGDRWIAKHWHVSKDRVTPDMSEEEAKALLAEWPDAWEVVKDQAKRDKPEPENHRMRKAPAKRRGKT